MIDVLLWIVLPTFGYALFIGTALWQWANRDGTRRVSWWASVGLSGLLLSVIMSAHLLID